MRRDFSDMCGGKNRYDTKKLAQTVINHIMNGRHKKHLKQLRAYPCPNCNGWHLTKT